MQRTVRVGAISVGAGQPLVLVAGPCVIEPDDHVMRAAARTLVEICGAAGVPLIFKASYEKDNRSDGEAYRGPGLVAGLALLGDLGRELGVPTTTDVHRLDDVDPAAAVVDLLQVPALLCRQTSLLERVGRSGRPVNIKKGQFMSPAAMSGAAAKVRAVSGEPGCVLLTERGTSFGYDALIVDPTSVPTMQAAARCPVLVDAGHAARRRELIPTLARAGVAAGADGLFLECHPDPPSARCDGGRMLSLTELERLLREIVPLARLMRELRRD